MSGGRGFGTSAFEVDDREDLELVLGLTVGDVLPRRICRIEQLPDRSDVIYGIGAAAIDWGLAKRNFPVAGNLAELVFGDTNKLRSLRRIQAADRLLGERWEDSALEGLQL